MNLALLLLDSRVENALGRSRASEGCGWPCGIAGSEKFLAGGGDLWSRCETCCKEISSSFWLCSEKTDALVSIGGSTGGCDGRDDAACMLPVLFRKGNGFLGRRVGQLEGGRVIDASPSGPPPRDVASRSVSGRERTWLPAVLSPEETLLLVTWGVSLYLEAEVSDVFVFLQSVLV